MRIVILDDYQDVSRDFEDWSVLDADIDVVTRPVTDTADLESLLAGAEVVVAMRERTVFDADRLSRSARSAALRHHGGRERLDRPRGGEGTGSRCAAPRPRGRRLRS